ncbi:hypothetical protein CPB86DRAFT_871467 [Serendipita vermifera]|nr:hypothetical protein CPB86DRAFT_871467 [Serendipita vermifera]
MIEKVERRNPLIRWKKSNETNERDLPTLKTKISENTANFSCKMAPRSLYKLPWQAAPRIPRPTQTAKSSNRLPKELKLRLVQNATPSQTVCPHTAPGSFANFEQWAEGEDSGWGPAERKILTMRDPVNREAGENDTAEIEQTAEDSEMDLDDLEVSQAALAAHVASVFAAYGVDTNN